MGLCPQQRANSISSWVTGSLFTCWINSWQTQSSSDPNFSQNPKGFKISSWVQIKQQYLTMLCFFFSLVWGLSSQYLNIFPRGSQRLFYPGPLFISLPAFISHSPFWWTVLCLSGAQLPFCLGGFLHWFSFALSISGHIPCGSLRHLVVAGGSV
jgi:hypothetical protein